MHEVLHILGFCADNHSHLDLMDIIAYSGIEKITFQLYWIKFKVLGWLRL